MSEETPKVASRRPITLDYNKPGSVKKLRASWSGRLKLPDAKTFLKEINGESDRAAVILAASMLDDLLANAIALKMPFDLLVADLEHIFRQGGPLESFSARTEIASLFGIIEDETYIQLSLLREMRNACAHSKHPIDFQHPALRNVLVRLFQPLGSTPLKLADIDIKMAFGLEVAFLILVLSQGSREKAFSVRSSAHAEIAEELKTWPEKPPEED